MLNRPGKRSLKLMIDFADKSPCLLTVSIFPFSIVSFNILIV